MTEASITELFEVARTVPEDGRAAFLDAACPDTATRREIERLLQHAADAPALFQRLEAGISAPASPEHLIGERIGNYRLDRCLGQGGMGVVYLAHRVDGEFEQQVALKLVRGELVSDLRRALFLRERQILARLDHPYIARLFDGGVTPKGTPYFVMEYVRGRALTAYADEQHLSLPERLQLFLKVCAAVGHAHRHMVVHQDLKPGNILVTADGTPKLLDFGIAGRSTATRADDAAADAVIGRGTPGYASPEQRRGDPVSSASDVYSLGLILRELAWGDRQLQPAQPGKLPAPRDLAWICARATEGEPRRRFASVDELAEDIDRYLSHRPVQARPSSLGYRLLRFGRRHQIGIAAAALVGVVVSLYVGSAITRARETARQRDRARLERDASHRVGAFLTQVLEAQRRVNADTSGASLRAALDDGVDHLEDELASASELHGVILRSIGEVYAQLGFPARSVATLHRSLQVLTAANGSEHPSVAGSWQTLGGVLLQEGCVHAAESALRRALTIQEARLRAGDPMLRRTREALTLAAAMREPGSRPPPPPIEAGGRGRRNGRPIGPPPGPPVGFGPPMGGGERRPPSALCAGEIGRPRPPAPDRR